MAWLAGACRVYRVVDADSGGEKSLGCPLGSFSVLVNLKGQPWVFYGYERGCDTVVMNVVLVVWL